MKRPKILEDAGFDIYVDTTRLRDLPLPVSQMSLDELVWCFDFPVWEKDGTDDWNLTPREVINGKPGTSDHLQKVHESNLDFPIIVIYHKGKWVILDGIHRLTKAYMLGNSIINVKILTEDSEHFKNAVKK